MSRAIDYITITAVAFLLTFVWMGYLTNLYIAILSAGVVTAVTVFTVYYVKSRKSKPYAHERLALELSVRGSKYLINLIKSTLKNADFENGDNFILLKDCIIIAAFKFAPLGINDIGNIFSLAMEKDRKRIFVLARGIDRRASTVLQSHGINISVVRIRAIFRYLESNHALPSLEKQKIKFSFSSLIETLLSRANTKNYLFSGAVLISFAFLTPLKIYYLIFGSLSLLLAALTITPLGKGSYNSEKIFDKLKAADKENADCDQSATGRKNSDNDNSRK